MQSKFGDNVCSIREVLSLRILKMTPPETQIGGKFQKIGNSAMFSKRILSSPENFGAVLR